MRLLFCWRIILGFLLAMLSCPAPAQPLSLKELPAESLGKWADVLVEDGPQLSLEEVQKQQRNGLFQQGSQAVLSSGIGSPPRWVHLELFNPANQSLPLRLEAGATWLDRLDVYVVQDNRIRASWQTGDEHPNAPGLTPGVGFTFTSDFAPGRSDLYLRVESVDPLVLPIRLVPAQAADERLMSYGYGLLYGYLLALIAYNLMLFAGMKERSYFYYSLYLASFVLTNIAYTGHGYAMLWPDQPSLQRYAILLLMVLYGCCGLLFASRFLALAEHAPRVQRIVRTSALSGLGLIALCIMADSQFGAAFTAFSFTALFTAGMVLLGILTVRHGRIAGRYFLIATIFGMLGAALTTFSVWGWLPLNSFAFHGVEYGIVIEATLLALALTHRFNEMNTRLSSLTVSRDVLAAEVAERKLAEERLRESEETLRQSQLIAGLGSYVLDTTEGKLKSSDVLDMVFGIDDTYPHTVEGWQALLHPDDRAAMSDYLLNEVLGQGKDFDREYRIIRHSDGAMRWIHGLGKLKFDDQGRPVRMYGTIQDITDRKQAEAALTEREAEKLHALNLLKVIADGSTDAIFAKDMNGHYLLYNREALRQSGKPLESILGKGDEEIYPPATAAKIKERDRAVIHSGHTITFEEKLFTVDGERIFLTTKGPMKNNEGGIFGIFGISHDITERKKTEQILTESMHQLEEKELAKSRFLAAAGHDLRQPLAAANLFIDALKLTAPNPEQTQIIERLDLSMSTFNGLLDALLNVSKLDAGMIKPEFTAINIADIFGWLEQSFAPLAVEKKIGLRLHFPMKGSSDVRCDSGLLKSAMMNLVSNAIKFTSRGAILVSARRRGNKMLFQVWDTGIGIPDEHIEKIYDEFYQVDNLQRDRSMGLGLGLSIAKRALLLLDERITCRSRLNHGSVFEFSLPLADTRDAPPRQETILSPNANAGNLSFAQGKRFMVVENDALVSEALSNALRAAGGEVNCFQSAEHALLHSHIDQSDYFIADYMLGNLNGIQFLGLLRQKLGKPIRAVIMTGDTSTAFVREADKCDWPILYKPVNISALLSSLTTQEGR